MTLLNEAVKSFLNKPEPNQDASSTVKTDNVLYDLGSDTTVVGSFYDEPAYNSLLNTNHMSDAVFAQKHKISKYRQVAMMPDVTNSLNEIVNEIIFSYTDEVPLKLNINEENDKLVEAIGECFKKIIKLSDLKRSLFQIVKRAYIDGILVFHCEFKKGKESEGIRSIKMIEPSLLYFDNKDEKYKYMHENDLYQQNVHDTTVYDVEEIVREDFGLYDGKTNLGYLEYALKTANMLSTMEDLLIPMRFSRSISRRVFNVDIGELPNKRGDEVMKEHQRKFKYKKFYNNETGEVSNQKHITSMVEDYWFANRNGGKGTTVDVMDETGNLGELNDILYLSRKLYTSMQIPSSRISTDPDSDHEFDYESTRVSKDDMKFFMFISRVRQVYSSAFKELLKREVVSTKVMTSDEWDDKEDLISITFTQQNKFVEKMEIDGFMSKIDTYNQAQEIQGKLFTVETLVSKIFGTSEEELKEQLKKIEKESKDKLFTKFYAVEDDGF